MWIERADNAVLGTAPVVGRPARPTNLSDARREDQLPAPKVWVDTPPGFSHSAPGPTPYLTGPSSLPKETDDD
jgi:hypothetical protein